MMSVDVPAGANPDIGTPQPLFKTRLNPVGNVDQYAVSGRWSTVHRHGAIGRRTT